MEPRWGAGAEEAESDVVISSPGGRLGTSDWRRASPFCAFSEPLPYHETRRSSASLIGRVRHTYRAGRTGPGRLPGPRQGEMRFTWPDGKVALVDTPTGRSRRGAHTEGAGVVADRRTHSRRETEAPDEGSIRLTRQERPRPLTSTSHRCVSISPALGSLWTCILVGVCGAFELAEGEGFGRPPLLKSFDICEIVREIDSHDPHDPHESRGLHT
jgi:hypothetical protein